MFELVCKENEKLTGENNLFRKEVEQYSNQISEFLLKTENLEIPQTEIQYLIPSSEFQQIIKTQSKII